MRKLPILLFAILLLSSCYEYTRLPNSAILDKYVGRSEHDILLTFGPADRTTSDGSGGKILDYRKNSDPVTVTGLYQDAENHLYAVSSSHTIEWYLQFYVNASGQVYTYRSNLPGPVISKKLKGPPKPHPLF